MFVNVHLNRKYPEAVVAYFHAKSGNLRCSIKRHQYIWMCTCKCEVSWACIYSNLIHYKCMCWGGCCVANSRCRSAIQLRADRQYCYEKRQIKINFSVPGPENPVVTLCTARFNTEILRALSRQCVYVFCMDLRTNSCHFVCTALTDCSL
jgi:hypothetical protein